MKSRPRRAENRIAEELTQAMSPALGDFEFKRVPVIGRSGPDLTYPNPLHMAVDVKSRLSVPKGLWKFFPVPEITLASSTSVVLDYLWVSKLADLGQNLTWGKWAKKSWSSRQVTHWLRHMEDWTIERALAGDDVGIPVVILHRPGMNYANSVFICWRHHRAELARVYSIHLLKATRCLPAEDK